jgi:carbon-monoxide dehydrogenase medium subunit
MSFVYHEPETLEEVLDVLTEHGDDARLLAGGTAFSLLYKVGLLRPGHVIGLRRLAPLRGIERRADGVWIGAHTTHREVEQSPVIRKDFPMLASAFAGIASVRIRSQATIGGNLCHADPAQDPPPPLIAAGAVAHIAGSGGRSRLVPLDEFFVDYYTSVVAGDEILLGVTVPPSAPTTASTFVRFMPRSAEDYATVSVAASVSYADDGTVDTATIALGGVGPTPIRADAVEAALAGRHLRPASIAEASAAVEDEVNPLSDARGSASYKRAMATVFVQRALQDILRRSNAGEMT